MYFTGKDASLQCRFHRSDGTYSDWTSVAQLTQFTLEHNIETISIKQIDLADIKRIPNYEEWSLTMTGNLDYTASGQNELTSGVLVDLLVLPESMDANQLRAFGKAHIESVTYNVSAGNGTEVSASFAGAGPVTLINQFPKYTPVRDDGSPYLSSSGFVYAPGTVIDPYNDDKPWSYNSQPAPAFTPYTDDGLTLTPVWPENATDEDRKSLPAPIVPADA